MVQTGTPNSIMTSIRDSLRANLSGQDPNSKMSRSTSEWIFCSANDDFPTNFGLPYVDMTLIDCPMYGNIDRDVSVLCPMRLQFLVRADKSSHRNTLRDAIPNSLTLQNSSHHITWSSVVDGREDTKRYSDKPQFDTGPVFSRYYTSLLIGTVEFTRNWS